jgi:hypothetical protein
MAFGIMQGAGALAGLGGGLYQGNVQERRGYERSTKQRKHGLSLMGVGDWGAIHQAQMKAGNRSLTADELASLREGGAGGSYLDLLEAGGIHGVRKQYQQDFMSNLEKGYGGARDAVTGAAREARGDVYGERQRGIADVQQGMQQAGLQSSNIAQQARANVSYQTSRALSKIDTALGQSLADLDIQQSGAMDAAMARNLGLDEQTAFEMMGYLVGPSGYGPNASSQYFGGSSGFQPQSIDMGAVGAGGAALGDVLQQLGGYLFGGGGGGGGGASAPYPPPGVSQQFSATPFYQGPV